MKRPYIDKLSFFLAIALALLGCRQSEDNPRPGETGNQPELRLPPGFPEVASEYTIPYQNYLGKVHLDPNNPTTDAGVELGRYLFYDKRLSKNSNISCASCHKQEFAFTDTATLSLGTDGQRGIRQSMSLVNLAFNDHFFWDGRSFSLEHQALFPIQDPLEMDLSLKEAEERLQADSLYPSMFKVAFGTDSIKADLIAKGLAQFVASIVSVNSRYDSSLRRLVMLTPLEEKGRELFFTHPDYDANIRGADCFDCHGGKTFMAKALVTPFVNNGLNDPYVGDAGHFLVTKDSSDYGKMKLVTLRNIAVTPPYMHDGRFKTLAEVVDHYSEGVKKSPTLDPHFTAASNDPPPFDDQLNLRDDEKEALIAFLHTLTDKKLLTDSTLSNPFPTKTSAR